MSFLSAAIPEGVSVHDILVKDFADGIGFDTGVLTVQDMGSVYGVSGIHIEIQSQLLLHVLADKHSVLELQEDALQNVEEAISPIYGWPDAWTLLGRYNVNLDGDMDVVVAEEIANRCISLWSLENCPGGINKCFDGVDKNSELRWLIVGALHDLQKIRTEQGALTKIA